MCWRSRFIATFLLSACKIFAQETSATRGFTLYERYEGSSSSLGTFTRLDSNLGYQLGSHFWVGGGLPVYFVWPSSSFIAAGGTHTTTGIGNLYGQFRASIASPIVNFASTITASAPTGDKDTGFSTGHATIDWSNYVDHAFGRLTPFGEVGLANSVADTLFFVRPFSTQGFITHVQGGARYSLLSMLTAGGSVYAIQPSGQQTVVSRVVTPAAKSNGKGKGHSNDFENESVTTGTSEIARDRGLSAWLKLSPVRSLDFYAGYTRSITFELDTVFFGVGVNVGRAFRRWGPESR